MRVPAYVMRELQLLRNEVPEKVWPRLEKLIEWADDGRYEYHRKKRKLTESDFHVKVVGERYLVTDVNGDAQYVTKGGLIADQWDAIQFVLADRRVSRVSKDRLNKGG